MKLTYKFTFDDLAGLALVAVLIAIAIGLTGCGTINAYNAVAVQKAATDYAGAKKTIQELDDMKLQAWLDTACAINLGALQRSASTGNGHVANAALVACPVPSVGVTSVQTNGSMQVQTTQIAVPMAAFPAK